MDPSPNGSGGAASPSQPAWAALVERWAPAILLPLMVLGSNRGDHLLDVESRNPGALRHGLVRERKPVIEEIEVLARAVGEVRLESRRVRPA